MWIAKLEDSCFNLFISQQIRVVFRDSLCKSSSVNKSNNFLNYLRNFIFIESWPILSGRHEIILWECIETEKVRINVHYCNFQRFALLYIPTGSVKCI